MWLLQWKRCVLTSGPPGNSQCREKFVSPEVRVCSCGGTRRCSAFLHHSWGLASGTFFTFVLFHWWFLLFEKVSKCGAEELSSVHKYKKAGMGLRENILLDELCLGFPGGSVGKESACSAGDVGSIPASWRSPGEGNGNPLQYPYLGNPMDRGAWWDTVQGITSVRHDFAQTWVIGLVACEFTINKSASC